MKSVRIAELKSRLSEYLRAVRNGATVTVLDRNTPVAKIIPIQQAGLRMPTEIGTLGSIHLATALLWRERSNAELVMATHHRRLGIAAQAHGFKVVGV
ncbi:MAG TPA: type II toxin-antitoxin system prevent-host-death family antitoxin [Terriglobales bacterium]|nr:type II toxin-antitoxin system prevent-host-death family antitoxin [Terriglobales bacterium]